MFEFLVNLCHAYPLEEKVGAMGKIIELPDNISESFENLIFVGLWLDNQKPAYDVFMSKCVETVLKAINSSELKKLG